jgi:hypothetical protein
MLHSSFQLYEPQTISGVCFPAPNDTFEMVLYIESIVIKVVV